MNERSETYTKTSGTKFPQMRDSMRRTRTNKPISVKFTAERTVSDLGFNIGQIGLETIGGGKNAFDDVQIWKS